MTPPGYIPILLKTVALENCRHQLLTVLPARRLAEAVESRGRQLIEGNAYAAFTQRQYLRTDIAYLGLAVALAFATVFARGCCCVARVFPRKHEGDGHTRTTNRAAQNWFELLRLAMRGAGNGRLAWRTMVNGHA